MKRFVKAGIAIVVVAVGAGFAMTRVKATVKGGAGGNAAAGEAAKRTVTAQTGDIAVKVSETGTLEPVSQVEVKSKVAGRVLKIFVEEGNTVKAGQPLAIIDPIEVTRQVDQTRAQLESARAGLKQAEENYALTIKTNALAVRRAEAALAEAKAHLTQTAAPNRPQDIEQARTAVQRAEAQTDDMKRTLTRKQSLVAKGFIAQADADAAQTQVTLAEKDVESARQHLSLMEAGARLVDVDSARAAVDSARIGLETERANRDQAQLRLRDVERARAEVRQIENQLAQQQVQVQDTRIIAPNSGQITGKYVNQGELIASATAGFAQGATLVRIADLTRMQVRVNVNEVDISRVHVGLPVAIRVDSLPSSVFGGKVAAIAPASLGSNSSSSGSGGGTQQGVVRFEVKVMVTTPDPRLRPGMTAAVDILLDQHKGVVTLPAEAIQSGDKVTVVTGKADKTVRAERKLSIGLRDDAKVEVLSGLAAGERVEVPKVSAADRRKVDFNGPD